MEQLKIFESGSLSDLENAVNEWLSNNDVTIVSRQFCAITETKRYRVNSGTYEVNTNVITLYYMSND